MCSYFTFDAGGVMQVGKGKCYNHACTANAMPGQNHTGLFLLLCTVISVYSVCICVILSL